MVVRDANPPVHRLHNRCVNAFLTLYRSVNDALMDKITLFSGAFCEILRPSMGGSGMKSQNVRSHTRRASTDTDASRQ